MYICKVQYTTEQQDWIDENPNFGELQGMRGLAHSHMEKDNMFWPWEGFWEILGHRGTQFTTVCQAFFVSPKGAYLQQGSLFQPQWFNGIK